ncbi:oxidation-reduction process [Gurleya vavrai]
MFSRSTIEMKKMQKKYGRDRLKFAFLDLSNPKSIKKIVRESIKDSKIDLLINNAGVYYRKIHFKNNVEYNFLVNYLGHYIFVESLKQNIQGRIVNVSSSAMYAATNLAYAKRVDFFMDNYSKSKYANALHALNLREEGFDSVSVHPGIIATDLFNNTQYNIFLSFLKLFLPFALTKVEQAAKSVLNAAFSKEKNENTLFFVNGKKANGSKYLNIKNALFLKERTETICEELKINFD